MNNEIINFKDSLPSIEKSSLNIFGNIISQYFNFKKNTAEIKYETKKLKKETKIFIKRIDSELQKSLNKNNNDFKREMYRLKTIAKSLDENAENKKIILENISELIKRISNPTTPLPIIEITYNLILSQTQLFQDESNQNIEKLKLMSDFNQNQILIEGR